MEHATKGETVENHAANSWFSGWLRWCPTSEELLEEAEAKILESLDIDYDGKYVKTADEDKIWTVSFNSEGENTPVLMVHGFGAGLGIWVLNIKELSRTRPVHTFDLLGFGRSARPSLGEEPEDVEEKFVTSIEDTRKELGLESFILIGHSFGGYLAFSYAIKYPDMVKSLILVDPWGFSDNVPDREQNTVVPKWIKVMAAVLSSFNPYATLRLVGPLGPSILRNTRPDLQKKFASVFPDAYTIPDYIYHCNAQTPSGETGFKRLTLPYLWPKYPMIHRIEHLNPQLKVFMLFGSRTSIDSSLEEIQAEKPEQFYIYTIKNAGHYVFADRPDEFNKRVQAICESVDSGSR